MSAEDNGNLPSSGGGGGVLIKPNSSSNEDLSEYTDADESISAPTEFLAEFLSAVMLKDYQTALKYCKLILQYEPNNATAKEFYPLILEKLRIEANNDNESEEEEASEESSGSGSDNSTSSSSSEESSEGQEEEEEDEVEVEQSGADKQSKGSSDGTTGSYSSLEDDEAVDQLVALARKYQIDNVNLGNGNKIYNTSTSAFLQNKAYSKMVPPPETNSNHQAATNFPFGTSSDSESPTEPVSQQTIKILRARVVPGNI
ncbi:unnamed protein product [Callosobruchus maculatus]|nr:unnamed protein product [Callosobruchus maculatus]